ncbi:hypothetical protein GQ55_9G113500 [Panicum hallii var. hallii]|uniref:RanBP2-type domain-containing protein n=1 Tax=Panicum hallii var. hallii TaxID=1504633 RepID=A0A2T7C1Y1_9POAL|nr:hypothetical protein GQ55_9G113500 [Panicum hallii var. hallii]
MHRRLATAAAAPALRRLSHHSAPPRPDPKLAFFRSEVDDLSLSSSHKPPSKSPVSDQCQVTEKPGSGLAHTGGAPAAVDIAHQWPEWVALMELLLRRGHVDPSAFTASSPSSKDANAVRTACLRFGRERPELIRHISRWDIQVALRCGCPSIDRKVVNSGKRLRAYVGLDEGEVCSQCNLRGSCERAYVKARKEEVGRTVDVMRILLTYGLDVITDNVENRACLNKTVKESIKSLLNDVVEVDSRGSGSSTTKSAQHKGQSALPRKQGDWNCPKCDFLNFAKNIKCLRCDGEFQERYQLLHEDQEHLPLKKGDWICKKCNFLNFAKNTRCLQCHEKPTNRLLNPGEWECVSTTNSLRVFPLLVARLLLPKILLLGRNGRMKCPGETKAYQQRNQKNAVDLLVPCVFLEAWSWLTLMMISPHGFRVELIIKIQRRHNQNL